MAEPFAKMDSTSKNMMAVLLGEIVFGSIAIHIHMNEVVATGTVVGSMLAALRFLVKPSVQIKKD